LQMIGKLYRIEREIKELNPENKYQQRQAHSIQVLEKLKVWVDKNQPPQKNSWAAFGTGRAPSA
jgi:hypothetical protein